MSQSVSGCIIKTHLLCGAICGAVMAKLTDLKARNTKPGDKPLADGTVPGLRLHPGGEKGHGKWLMRFKSPTTGKRRDMGFGTYPEVSLSEARERAADARTLLRKGLDPIDERNALVVAQRLASETLNFEQAAEQAYESKKKGWSNPKHAAQWIKTLRDYAYPVLGNKKIDALRPHDFATMLQPIWLTKVETAYRVKQRCDVVMEWCIGKEFINTNPVKSIGSLLPEQPGKRERVVRLPSLPWQNLPEFVTGTLQADSPSLSAVMLEFLILTAARSREVREMEWDEVDFDSATWTVPASHMKTKVEHRVPLSDRAVEILKAQKAKAEHPALVFPSSRRKVTTDMILTKFLRDKNVPSDVKGRTATAHGFRSSFRNWASENGYSQEAAERALAHTIKNSAEWSYHRTDLLDQRRTMMQSWADFVCNASQQGSNVVKMKRQSKKS